MNASIFVVGIGPGGYNGMTAEAIQALEACDCIVGYTTYIKLIEDVFPDKKRIATGMTKEIERCRLALELAQRGQQVALISGGDAGVYGMAGIMHEIASECGDVEVAVVAGVTAACSGAALLGAPLVSDACFISLSDLLTPWHIIEKRLRSAADGDFVICLYNPASKTRIHHLRRACEILLESKAPETPAGIVRNIGRRGETAHLTTLERLKDVSADMFSTVFIGNSQTKIIGGKMVTPRGYRL